MRVRTHTLTECSHLRFPCDRTAVISVAPVWRRRCDVRGEASFHKLVNHIETAGEELSEAGTDVLLSFTLILQHRSFLPMVQVRGHRRAYLKRTSCFQHLKCSWLLDYNFVKKQLYIFSVRVERGGGGLAEAVKHNMPACTVMFKLFKPNGKRYFCSL